MNPCIPIFQQLIRRAELTKEWLVIVTPENSPYLKGFRTFGIGLFPPGSDYTGRTVHFPKGGKLSVVSLTSLFDAPDKSFSVVFLGEYDPKSTTPTTDALTLAVWRKRAKSSIFGGL